MELTGPALKLGVTATQRGLSAQQRSVFLSLVLEARPEEFHHGGCIGGDDELQYVIAALTAFPCVLVMHRGDTPEKWADCDLFQNEIKSPKPNLERNRDIVDGTNELWAFPGEQQEVLRSGTWATIRYARDKRKKPVTVVYPDGSLSRHNYV